jgi:hypothetical protein
MHTLKLLLLDSCSIAHCKSASQLPRPERDEESPSSTLFTRLGTLGLFLFGYAKRNLIGYRAENLSEFLVRIQVILTAIQGQARVEGFLEWMK